MKLLTVLSLICLCLLVSGERMRNLWEDTPSSHMKWNCKNWDQKEQTCIECFEGCTKWQNICVKIVKYCAKWDQQGNCTDCEKGYGDTNNKAINGSCPQKKTSQTGGNTNLGTPSQPTIPQVDVNCQCHNEDRMCVDCFAGYYLDANATCQLLPQNCTAADEQGLCTACIPGWTVENGECVQQQCDLSLCATFNADQTECASCPQRSYLENGCCYEVNGYCSKWIESTGVCTQCYQGYEINKANNKECVLSSSP